MKYFQPLLLLLMAVFTQCTSTAPAKMLPDLFKSDPAVIKSNNIRLSRYYEVKYDDGGNYLKRKLVKTSYYDSTGKVFLIVRPGYSTNGDLPEEERWDLLTGRWDSVFYTYDGLGRIEKAVSHGHANSRLSVEVNVYKYDSIGNQVLQTRTWEGVDTVSFYTNYVYGKNGRVLYSESGQFGGAVGKKKSDKVEYAYDHKGNIIKLGDISYKYKGDGQLMVHEQVNDDYKFRTEYKYNDADKCIGLVIAMLDIKKNIWDSVGRGEYTYDKRNLLMTGKDTDLASGGRTTGFIYEYE